MFKIHSVIFLIGLTLISACKNTKTKEPATTTVSTTSKKNIKVYNYDELEPLLQTQSDTTYIINFWATWCAPCVKELPHFNAYYEKHKNEKMKMIMVSMDDPKEIETRILPFIKKKKIQQEVVILDDPDANTWIDKIDPHWSGALPFTILFNKNSASYFEKPFSSTEALENAIKNNLH
ncbi:TlpA disulfide reductase family protein [Cellulophaga sp. L1A9]|uniref:TlpA disulfide reductase family protein n=1 Tax=Cellulophaga sp. L1A9 TaxID=2686362 RepID=UPI00131C926C|nr:TlpA disulfide reductase family protein [Cellulophaga sp. L1A9]